jgi:hypothetical protein
MDALIPVPESGGRVSDPHNRRNRNPFTQAGRFPEGSAERQEKGRKFDAAVLRRYGMNEKQAKRLAAFAAHRGGLDSFANIEAAKRAFRESGAFTDRALTPAATKQVSGISQKSPTDVNVGATDLIGLPLIRRG